MEKIRVLVVDDSTVVRRLVADALGGDAALEVVGVAANGRIALTKIGQLNPDVVTLDVEMPDLDGLAVLKEVRKTHPKLPVIMFSTLTQKGAVATIDALSLGASDYVAKPANVGSVTAALQKVREELIPRIKSLCPRLPQNVRREPARPVVVDARPRRPSNAVPRPVEIICIAVSTGGPNALADIFRQLPGELRVPIVIVQHMPPVFTTYLAQRLTANSALHVFEARTGDALRPGCAWLAPGDFHLTLERHAAGVFTALNQGPPENSCRPAADTLFRSVAEVYGAGTLGVVLTGMGQDGLRGCEAIHVAGGRIIVQDEPSSVVWGMAGAVFRAGLADEVLPLAQVPARLAQLAGLRSSFQSLVTTGSSL